MVKFGVDEKEKTQFRRCKVPFSDGAPIPKHL